MDSRFLQSMYQQWCDGQHDTCKNRWLTFVELVAKHYGVGEDQVMRELQKHRWFKWGDE